MNNLGSNPVLNFARAMQGELDKNAHKGEMSWRSDCQMNYLIKRLKEEVREIEKARIMNKPNREIIAECADVGNFAMMIADNYDQY